MSGINFVKLIIIEIWEMIKYVLVTFEKIFPIIETIDNMPKTLYELVKLFFEENYIFFGNKVITKILMLVIPLIVSIIITCFTKIFGKTNYKIKTIMSIALYIGFVKLFSVWYFWLILLLIIVSIVILWCIIKKINNNSSHNV